MPTRVIKIDSTQSTNADAMRLAQGGETAPFWVMAREQTSGRGRLGRMWHSPPGNLYASLALVDPCEAALAPQIGFVAGVALAEAADALLGPASVRLKWPNDLLHEGAKLSGMLLEASRRVDGAFICVVGIGVNCRSHPTDLPYRANDLSAIARRDIAPDDLLAVLDAAFLRWLASWDRGRNFTDVRNAWLRSAAGLGDVIEAASARGKIRGRFEAIDAQGRLVLITDDGRVTIDAGDVYFSSQTSVPLPERVT